jgi:hypothetical protein
MKRRIWKIRAIYKSIISIFLSNIWTEIERSAHVDFYVEEIECETIKRHYRRLEYYYQ